MLYRAESEFVINTRVPWESRDDSLREHIDALVEELKESETVRDISVDADLARSAATLIIVAHVEAANHDPEAELRQILAGAINRSGALHEHLMPLADEAQQKPQSNAWWGLLTPRWSARSVRFGEYQEGDQT